MFLSFFGLPTIDKILLPNNLEIRFFDQHSNIELRLDGFVLYKVIGHFFLGFR